MRSLIVIFVVALAGCGVSNSAVGVNDPDPLEDGAKLSTTSRSYVGLRPDLRKCIGPTCGGYFVHDVNRATVTEKYVSGLDFSSSGLSNDDQARVLSGIDQVVLRGKLGPQEPHFGTQAFIVSEAYRGLPGLTLGSGDGYFKVQEETIECITAPCPTLSEVRVNHTTKTLFHELSLTGLGFVDQAWLNKRVTEGGAIASGTLATNGNELTLEASNVFLQLPEVAGPCTLLTIAMCPAGQVRTFTRTADRCLIPDACVTQGVCNILVPNCGPGYTANSWKRSPNACEAVACDPSWLTE
jgi:hypothetical protein